MKKTAIYSRAGRPAAPAVAGSDTLAASQPSAREAEAEAPRSPSALSRTLRRIPALNWLLMVALLVTTTWALTGQWQARRSAAVFTPAQLKAIDVEVRRSLSQRPLPSPVAKAYERIAPSVVRVVGLGTPGTQGTPSVPEGIGTGVVIVDNGTILTNLHVVQRARRIKVMFSDGHESTAELVSVDAANDLAVLRAKTIPDDLQAATLRSTADLQPGDTVVTVGFPFGIGPSVSSGVISGLQREYRSPDGQQVISNLIQFDAAANPGNSGGPLLTQDGEVVGIVTAILNPAQQRVFIGIGFAVPIENAASGAGLAPF
ncbi:MAG: trypsin-like peptidase domain-containing protein [Pseudomonadota bacterium]